jgi:hypothetical protein
MQRAHPARAFHSAAEFKPYEMPQLRAKELSASSPSSV